MTGLEIFLLVVGLAGMVWHLSHMTKLFDHWTSLNSIKEHKIKDTALELIEISSAFYSYSPALETKIEEIEDDFLKESLQLYLLGTVRGHEYLYGLKQKAEGYRWAHHTKLTDLRKLILTLPIVGWAAGLCIASGLAFEGFNSETISHYSYVYAFILGILAYGMALFHFVVHPTALKIESHANIEYQKNLFIVHALSLMFKKSSTLDLFNSIHLLLPVDQKIDFADLEHGFRPQLTEVA